MLRPPFDPCCERIPRHDAFVSALRSRTFDHLQNAEEVRSRAIALLALLNGVMGVSGNTEPLTLDSVGQIDDEGRIRLTFFAELHERLRATVTATAEVRDAQGNLVPPPQPEPSAAQTWTKKAEGNETVADMLVFAGRADNWFDIFKTIEAAEDLVGGERELQKVLGSSGQAFKRMKRTANNLHRHRPGKFATETPTPMGDAKPLLSFIVRTVMDSYLAAQR